MFALILFITGAILFVCCFLGTTCVLGILWLAGFGLTFLLTRSESISRRNAEAFLYAVFPVLPLLAIGISAAGTMGITLACFSF